jgi:hypothetical protein
MKVYNDDPLVKYVNTTIPSEKTKDEISSKLVEYHVSDIFWHWKPDLGDIWVQFGIEEVIDNKPIAVLAKVICPVIWQRAAPKSKIPINRFEHIDMKASMRAMYWYIKSHLESSYAMQSSMLAGFLPNIVTAKNEVFFKTVLERVTEFAALPEPEQREIPVEVVQTKRERINVTNL